MITSRRSFLTGLTAALITAPAIVRATSLMPVKAMPAEVDLKALLAQRYADALEVMKRNLVETVFYSNADYEPVVFNGVQLAFNGGFPFKQIAVPIEWKP